MSKTPARLTASQLLALGSNGPTSSSTNDWTSVLELVSIANIFPRTFDGAAKEPVSLFHTPTEKNS